MLFKSFRILRLSDNKLIEEKMLLLPNLRIVAKYIVSPLTVNTLGMHHYL